MGPTLPVASLSQRCRWIPHHDPSTLILNGAGIVSTRNCVVKEARRIARSNEDLPIHPCT